MGIQNKRMDMVDGINTQHQYTKINIKKRFIYELSDKKYLFSCSKRKFNKLRINCG